MAGKDAKETDRARKRETLNATLVSGTSSSRGCKALIILCRERV